MWATSSRTATKLQVCLTLNKTTLLSIRLPTLSLGSSSSSPFTPALSLATPASSTSTPSPSFDIASLWDGLLRAVPKKKVSHSRKSMRAANKGLKDRTDLVHCSGCGKPKLHHHICSYCYFELNRARKVALKQASDGGKVAQAEQ